MLAVWANALHRVLSSPPPQTHQAFLGCLVIDRDGPENVTAQTTWAGMRDASDNTGARVWYFVLPGGFDAKPQDLGILDRRCDIVFAAGPAAVAWAREWAPSLGIQFAIVGEDASGTNLRSVPNGSVRDVRNRVQALMIQIVMSSGK